MLFGVRTICSQYNNHIILQCNNDINVNIGICYWPLRRRLSYFIEEIRRHKMCCYYRRQVDHGAWIYNIPEYILEYVLEHIMFFYHMQQVDHGAHTWIYELGIQYVSNFNIKLLYIHISMNIYIYIYSNLNRYKVLYPSIMFSYYMQQV